MQKVVIFEGPDGGGKSTAAARVGEILGREVVTTGGPKYSAEEIDRAMSEIEAGAGKIFDRCSHISNPIYSSVDGRDDPFPLGLYKYRLSSFRPIIVYCRLKSVDDMLARMVQEKKDHKPPEYMELVKERYPLIVRAYDLLMLQLWRDRLCSIITYSWEDYPADLLAKQIVEIEEF